MATIQINTTPEEQNQIMEVLKTVKGQTIPVSKIAQLAGMNQNRVRYIITDLLDAGKIKKIPTKAFNKHYVRYKYEVL